MIKLKVHLQVLKEATSSKKFFLPVWKWVKQGLTSGPFQLQPMAYDDLHTQPVPRCFNPISFGLRPIPNQALRPLTKLEAYDLLVLRRTCFCGTNADLATASRPLPPFFLSITRFFSALLARCLLTVYSHFPPTWSNYSRFSIHNFCLLTNNIYFSRFNPHLSSAVDGSSSHCLTYGASIC